MEANPRIVRALGIGIMICLAGLVVGLILLGDRTLAPGYVVHADFDLVANLKEGAEVRFSSLRIGKVLSLRQGRHLDEPELMAHIRVDLWIEKAHRHLVRKNSQIYINAKGTIGERYVEMGAPKGEPENIAKAGDVIRAVDTLSFDSLPRLSYRTMLILKNFLTELEPDIIKLRDAATKLSTTIQQQLPPETQQRLNSQTQLLLNELQSFMNLFSIALFSWEELGARPHRATGATFDGSEDCEGGRKPEIDSNEKRYKIFDPKSAAFALNATRQLCAIPSSQRNDLVHIQNQITSLGQLILRISSDSDVLPAEKLNKLWITFQAIMADGRKISQELQGVIAQLALGRGTLGRILSDPSFGPEIQKIYRKIRDSANRPRHRPTPGAHP